MIRYTAERKSLYVNFDPPSPLYGLLCNCRTIYADARRVKQILVNLLTNAVKFTLKGGITISYEVKENEVHTSVKDTGLGIKSEDMSKLFTEFCTISTHQSLNLNGTGLGLYLSKSLAKLMDGDITVESVFGEGCKFTLILPLNSDATEIENVGEKTAKSADMTLTTEISTHHLKGHDGNRRALVVDDNPISSFVISEIIKRYSMDSDTALNGKQAIELAEDRNKSYSVIFMDINMPVMSGNEVEYLVRCRLLVDLRACCKKENLIMSR
eukprot:TRINITY_DN8093_c0_g3_i2.p2 TRINITY_DN8093_c0_g3~~TRINITY_DN8093_c0_g3_i2.p2  ORF type:complete len:269 (-),score=44.01 TRINITY_DN8093_c0_g3_i2:106-912(-)